MVGRAIFAAMYVPAQYRETDRAELLALMRQHPFAVLTGVIDGLPVASHIPIELKVNPDGSLTLVGHISLANALKKCIIANQTMLIIFQAEHTYISPSWYDHLNVPTWNYRAVHCYGPVYQLVGSALREAMSALVHRHEGNRPGGVLMETVPEEDIAADLRGIVGFEMTVERIEGVAKLSQNRDDANYQAIIEKLEADPDPNSQQIAAAMRKRRPL